MNALDKIKEWLGTYPGYDILGKFTVDYTDKCPNNGGIFPSGLTEASRSTDIFGNVTVQNQLNFGLFYVFEKSPGDDTGSEINADWVSDFQEWVQEQSVTGKAPVFGDKPRKETVKAQNGVLYEAGLDGVATYMIQLTVNYIKEYPKEG